MCEVVVKRTRLEQWEEMNGKNHGRYVSRHDNGKPGVRCSYKDGKLDGLYEQWYSNGQPFVRCTYRNGVWDGLYELRYDNGKIKLRSMFKDGKWDRFYEEWDIDGKPVCNPYQKAERETGLVWDDRFLKFTRDDFLSE